MTRQLSVLCMSFGYMWHKALPHALKFACLSKQSIIIHIQCFVIFYVVYCMYILRRLTLFYTCTIVYTHEIENCDLLYYSLYCGSCGGNSSVKCQLHGSQHVCIHPHCS